MLCSILLFQGNEASLPLELCSTCKFQQFVSFHGMIFFTNWSFDRFARQILGLNYILAEFPFQLIFNYEMLPFFYHPNKCAIFNFIFIKYYDALKILKTRVGCCILKCYFSLFLGFVFSELQGFMWVGWKSESCRVFVYWSWRRRD